MLRWRYWITAARLINNHEFRYNIKIRGRRRGEAEVVSPELQRGLLDKYELHNTFVSMKPFPTTSEKHIPANVTGTLPLEMSNQ